MNEVIAHNDELDTMQTCSINDICRLCANLDDNMVPIYANEGIDHMLEKKIKTHLPFINICKDDLLPKTICYHCASAVLVWNELYVSSSNADHKLRNMFEASQYDESDTSKNHEPYEDIEGIHNMPVKDFIAQSLEYDKIPSTSNTEDILNTDDKSSEIPEGESLNPSLKRSLCRGSSSNKDRLLPRKLFSYRDRAAVEINGGAVANLRDLYRCDKCDSTFIKVSDKQRHARTVCRGPPVDKPVTDTNAAGDGGRFKCDICADYRADGQTAMDEHTRQHADGRCYMCDLCNCVCDSKTAMRRHMAVEHPQRRRGRGQQKHRSAVNAAASALLYHCESCDKAYDHRSKLVRHVKIHRRPATERSIERRAFYQRFVEWTDGTLYYKCDQCTYSCVSIKRRFLDHYRTHTGEKPYMCDVCHKQFGTMFRLRRHIAAVHERIKEYACDVCGRCFAEKRNVDDHRRTHTGEKPFVCTACGKCFAQRASLGIHNRLVHLRVRSHRCTFCDRTFGTRSELTCHLKRHRNERDFMCGTCGKAFVDNHSLKRHMSVHSDDRPFACHICGDTFKLNKYLKQHSKVHRIKQEPLAAT